jgi:hypothetical protein
MGASPSSSHHIAERGGGSTKYQVERPTRGANLVLTLLLLIDVQGRSVKLSRALVNTNVSVRNPHLVWYAQANSVTGRLLRLT